MADNPRTPINVVMLSQGQLTNGKTALRFARLDDIAKPLAVEYKAKRHGRLRVGHVYTFEIADGGGSFYIPQVGGYVGEFDRPEIVREWQAEQKASDLMAEQAAQEKKHAGNATGLEAAIEPLRQVYQNLPYPQRLGFELYVLSVIRRR